MMIIIMITIILIYSVKVAVFYKTIFIHAHNTQCYTDKTVHFFKFILSTSLPEPCAYIVKCSEKNEKREDMYTCLFATQENVVDAA